MLCLGRMHGEEIIVEHAGEKLRIICLVAQNGQDARLGFEGPMSFVISRPEVTIKRAEAQARKA